MDLEKIEGLVKILEKSSLKTMSVRDGEFKITMSKLDNPPVISGAAGALPMTVTTSVTEDGKASQMMKQR